MEPWLAITVAVGSVCASGIAVVSFWMNFATKIANNKAAADAAMEIAQEAKKDAHEASEKIALQSVAFGLYREQIAREYIHREVMREVEERLTAAIDRLGDRLDRVLEKQAH
jgi:DNA-binding protein H-NS